MKKTKNKSKKCYGELITETLTKTNSMYTNQNNTLKTLNSDEGFDDAVEEYYGYFGEIVDANKKRLIEETIAEFVISNELDSSNISKEKLFCTIINCFEDDEPFELKIVKKYFLNYYPEDEQFFYYIVKKYKDSGQLIEYLPFVYKRCLNFVDVGHCE